MFELDKNWQDIVAAFPALNKNLRSCFAHHVRNDSSGIIRRVLIVGALCDCPAQLDVEDFEHLESVIMGLESDFGITLHPNVEFDVCNLIYGQNFLDPESQKNHPADLVILSYVYTPTLHERLRLEQGHQPLERRYRQVDPERHFLADSWSNAAQLYGAQIVSVIHTDDMEVGPDRFEGPFLVVKDQPVYESFYKKKTTLFKNEFVLPACR